MEKIKEAFYSFENQTLKLLFNDGHIEIFKGKEAHEMFEKIKD